jgi:predicted  nucleic acid-binding Zn-ribbon protein
VKKLNKTILDLKIDTETIKKSQRKNTLEIENLRKRSGVIDKVGNYTLENARK